MFKRKMDAHPHNVRGPKSTRGRGSHSLIHKWTQNPWHCEDDGCSMIGYFLKYEVLETFSKVSEVKLKKKVFNLVLVVK